MARTSFAFEFAGAKEALISRPWACYHPITGPLNFAFWRFCEIGFIALS